jgi:hypothetical protein
MPSTTVILLMAMLFTLAAAGIWGFQWTVEQVAVVKFETNKSAQAAEKKKVPANFSMVFPNRVLDMGVDETFKADLIFTGDTTDVKELNLVFAYEPKNLEIVEVTNGEVFDKEVETKIDEEAGLVFVKLEMTKDSKLTTGIVASLELTQLTNTESGLTLQGMSSLVSTSSSTVKFADGSLKPVFASSLIVK